MRFSLGYVGFYLLLYGLGFFTYVVRDHRIDVELYGGTGLIAANVAFIVAVVGVVAFFFAYMSLKSGRLFQELADSKVINACDVRAREAVRNGAFSVEQGHQRIVITALGITGRFPLPGVSALVTALTAAAFIYLNTWPPSGSESVAYGATVVWVSSPAWMLAMYMTGMIIARVLVNIWGLHKVLRASIVNVQPLHPDKVGGLRTISDYALGLSYLIAMCGLGLVGSAYLSGQSESLDKDYLLWVGIGLYVALAPLAFFGTLGSAHGPMWNVKARQLLHLSDRFAQDYAVIHEELDNDTEDMRRRIDRLQQVHAVYGITERFPVWPFDWASLRLFAGAVSSPLILTAATILARGLT